MRLETILFVIFILIIFIIIYNSISLLTQYNYTKNNIQDIRCDPMFIPFAGMFGLDSQENSKFCMKHIQKQNIDEHMHDTKQKTQDLEDIGSEIGNKVSSIGADLSGVKDVTSNLFSGISSMMINTVVKFQKMMYHFKSLTGKVVTSGNVLVNVANTGVNAGESIVNGPIIKTLNTLCFDPETIVKLNNGTELSMKNTKIGDVLDGGSTIIGKVDVKNHYDDHFYAVQNGNRDILVTGTHLLFDESVKRFRKVSENPIARQTNIKKDMFHCLITDDHQIKIGDHIFWDYDD
jgi:hypothetical protein